MRTFIADIIPKIQRFSKKLDDLTKLTNQHWVSIDDISLNKKVFIFRTNNQLLISENGIIEKCSWEYLGNQSLLIDTKHKSYLFKHGFFDENILALKLDSEDRFVFFVNETKYDKELNNIDAILRFLSEKYLNEKSSPNNISSKARPTLKSTKLPPPNIWVEQMLMCDSQHIIDTTLNWKQFCDSHSPYYPLYTYQELWKRDIGISDNLNAAFENYAKWSGYKSFESMKNEYFFITKPSELDSLVHFKLNNIIF